ncbi:MAG: ABC transporter ATP-binding protein [Anaerorhabdus sp.]|uniref:ABC transporter ATP-binding protein n=1 Tax=Anaerorhabdus sp. TaxID=1872524 RepID=UPI002FC9C09C
MKSNLAIKVNHVSKTYNNGVQALCDFNLEVKEGEVFTLLGENGAGKSTIIKILTTLMDKTSGDIEIFDCDIKRDVNSIRKQIACVFQYTSMDMFLSLEENMLLQSDLYHMPKDEAIKRMKMLVDMFDLNSYCNRPVQTFSGGVKRKLDIAMTLMSNPKILFLDEPTVGMDVHSRNALWDMVKKIKKDLGTTIFLTTHYLHEAESLSDTVCIMNKGKEVIQGSYEELKELLNTSVIEIKLNQANVSDIVNRLKQEFGNIEITIRDKKIMIKNQKERFHSLMKYLIKNNVDLYSMGFIEPSLEDIFIQVMQGGLKWKL